MQQAESIFTPTEWKLMECLWTQGPCTGRQAVEYLEENAGWSRSTTLTMLRRMTEKGAVSCSNGEDGIKTYTALAERTEAARRETADFLGRVYQGSVSRLVSAMTEKQQLSPEEIEELYAILAEAKK